MSKFMERAVDLAAKNVREGGQPYGAVLVKDNEIAAESVNTLHKEHDISGHAEMIAIRKLQKELQTYDLSDYSVYASGEPCEMCLTAMYFTGIRDIYYRESLSKAVEKGFDDSEVMSDSDLNNLKHSMQHLPLSDYYVDPTKMWIEKHS